MRVVSAFQALEDMCNPVTWASARSARSSPGCNIAGLKHWAIHNSLLKAASGYRTSPPVRL